MNRWPLVLGLLTGAALGCQDDTVRTLRVPKPPPIPLRTVAVMVPRDDATWFFKLSGPDADVRADEADFAAFVNSVTFAAGDKPLTWVLPERWRNDPGGKSRGMVARYATLRTPNGDEVIITRLGPEAKELRPNVDRWRREIGLGPATDAELASGAKDTAIGGAKAIRVELSSPGRNEDIVAEPPAPAVQVEPPPPAGGSQLKYQVPPGWQTASAQMSAASFRAGNGAEAADVTITPLGGPAGGVGANVNRWRGQIGLTPVSEQQAAAEAKELTVEGRPAQYFDLLGPAGANRQRILAVIVPRGGMTWFVKMRGTADTVARQQANFESFVRSLQLPAGG